MRLLTGQHYQNAYVTRDLKAAVARFEHFSDIRKKIEVEARIKVKAGDERGDLTQNIALVWIEDLQIELIEPVSGLDDIYRAGLADHDGIAFHHICQRVDDWDKQLKLIEQSPFPVVLEGSGTNLEFVYVDTRKWLGHVTEFTWIAEANWAGMGGR